MDLSKMKAGETINLSKGVAGLDLTKGSGELTFGLGFAGKNGGSIDLDSFITTLDSEGKALEFIYFSNRDASGIHHNGDDTTGGGAVDAPNETIDVKLNKLSSSVNELVIGLFIYTGVSNLGEVDNAFTNLTTPDGTEVCRFDVKEDFSKCASVEVARAIRNSQGEWEYKAIGKGSTLDYSGIKSASKRGKVFSMEGTVISGAKSLLGRIFGS